MIRAKKKMHGKYSWDTKTKTLLSVVKKFYFQLKF